MKNKAKYYIDELNAIDEHVRIEAKQCTDRIDKSVLETVCSFSNEPDLDGGVIILGIEDTFDDKTRYAIKGVTNVDKLQNDLATQCADLFNHPVRPTIEIESVEGKKVMIVTVHELNPKQKPLYFKKEGLPRGAWRRIGSTDQRCTEEDLAIFYTDTDGFDKMIAPDTDLDDIDENAVRRYRTLREKVNPDAEELNYSDIDLLRSLKAISKDKTGNWRLTNTGLLVFGKQMAIRREMPSVRVDYIRVPGNEWISDPHHRFDSIDMRGSMLLMTGRAFNAIAEDLPRGFALAPGNLQANRPLSVPEDVLREAIVNALIHQSLRVHRPIQIIRYSNRIEITNPGFSLKPEESLGDPGSEMRNPTIGSIFHETQLAEAKGTGIGTMRRLLKEAGMMPPTFESDRGRNTFTTRILLHHFLSESDLKWLATFKNMNFSDCQKTALIFLREVGAIDNMTYRQLSGASSRDAAKELKQLENFNLIEMKGQGRKAYYIPSDKLKILYDKSENSIGYNGVSYEPKGVSSEPKGVSSEPKGVSSESKGVSSGDIRMPENIIFRIQSLRQRVPKTELSDLITDLCSTRPLSIEELGEILGRTTKYLRKILPELIKDKRIKYTYPEMVNHPNQKYIATTEIPSHDARNR
ncbi:MAG: putative DNA binding domain-containing protein [Muribaculaceae bacterium]|nr:putative DNA binding domain-containing protein [Muribaculaceae bacterium]